MPGANTALFLIEAPGPLAPPWDQVPVDICVEESGSLSAVVQLRFLDPDRALLGETGIGIGTPLTIRVQPGDETAALPLFSGEVVALEAEFDGQGSFTTVRALDLSHRLRRGRRITGFVGQTASDIAAAVAARAGIPVGRIDETVTTYPLRTQPNVSDWEFLVSLAEESDREMVVEDGSFYFRAPVPASSAPESGTSAAQSPYVVEMGENVLSIRSSVSSVNQVGKVAVRGWDVTQKKGLLSEQTVSAGAGPLVGLDPSQAVAPFPASELLVTDVPYRTDAEVQAVSAALAAELAAAMAELELTALGNPHLRVGKPVSVTGAGQPFDGKYTVTAARHTDRPGVGYQTWITVSGRQDRTLHGLVTGASAAARSPRVPGVAIGVVTDIQAPEELAGQGWVRLKFPWLSDASDGAPAYVSDWVRTVQWGGAGGGGVFSPEVHDEVLVAFEQGLLDRPYVIGGLYNGVDQPTEDGLDLVDDATGKLNRRSLASRSGHRIELLDAAAGPAGVRLRTHEDKLSVHLDQQNTVITVHSDGKVTVTATEEVTVTGRGITLDAGSGALTLTGESVSVSGKSGLSLDGGPECSVKGGIVKIN
ncbi:VgrG-related protein [Kitasatospora sp. MAP5-34]|uniref:VgrG-related protein n=1 Tax=Kitasatospora sp. MAP5-34 TaxID=3035102 RepID=UPI0024748D59|nr:VgrG-related protein [Kitasatospora sp. MAP5-34]MDH6577881.1 phage protein D [Kitasatospora sp. MAP5-34]